MIKKTLFKAYIEIINYNTFTTIFLFKKTIRMSTNKLRCYSQESFRRELIKRDQHCILSGLSAEVSEAAHIVNKEYLETDNKELRFTKQNGILLNSCLHKEFDLHFWTVEINQEEWDENKKNHNKIEIKCNIKLYPPALKKKLNHLKLSIFNYDSIIIPMGCVPFFNIRNKIVEQKFYNPNSYSEDLILKYIKPEFSHTTSITETQITSFNKRNVTKKKNKSKTKTKQLKKRSRYTKAEITFIRDWIRTFKYEQKKPSLEERKVFCKNIDIDDKIFESRFVKYWNDTKIN